MDKEFLATMNRFRSASIVFSFPEFHCNSIDCIDHVTGIGNAAPYCTCPCIN